jgi:DNA-binding LacI/PurR family transcriptional regulator
VRSAIRELDYQPHAGARALRSNRTNVVGLVMPFGEPADISVLPFVGAIAQAAHEYGVNLLLLTADRGANEVRRVVQSAMVDSLIVLQVNLQDEHVEALAGIGRPVVLIGDPEVTQGLPCIDLDFHRAGRMLVEHLSRLGHHSVGYIGQPQVMFDRNTAYVHRALAGAQEAASDCGMTWLMEPCDATRSAVDRATRDLFARRPTLTSLVVFNEPAVPLVIDSLVALGKRVPEDISVVAIANKDALTAPRPAISGVSVPAAELGRRAAQLVMDPDAKVPTAPILLPPEFVRRDSDMPPTAENQ